MNATLEPHYDALERELDVADVQDESLGGNNREIHRRAQKEGIGWHAMRSTRRVRGEQPVLQGCPTRARSKRHERELRAVGAAPWSAALLVLPRGARDDRGRPRAGVVAVAATGRRVTLRARRGGPHRREHHPDSEPLASRSGLSARAIGKHFQAHPGVGVAGVFDRPIGIGLRHHAGRGDRRTSGERGFQGRDHLDAARPPRGAYARRGASLMRKLGEYPNIAVWGLQVRAEAEGVVKSGVGGRDKVVYSLTKRDMEKARKALSFVATLMLEQGAREIWPGVFGMSSVMTSTGEARGLAEGPLDSRAYGFIATHLFGAARIGPTRLTSVVDLDFETHEARNLHVVDSSIFPTTLGVNPQHTIMAVARLAATRIAEKAASRTRGVSRALGESVQDAETCAVRNA